MMRCVVLLLVSALVGSAVGQITSGEEEAFDQCGVLVSGSGCVLLDTGGARYVVVNVGDFQFGDEVRVVGTLDPNCITICDEAEGCIRGAEVYNPAIYPCGSAIPSFPEDLLSGACLASSIGLFVLTIGGLWLTRRGRRA